MVIYCVFAEAGQAHTREKLASLILTCVVLKAQQPPPLFPGKTSSSVGGRHGLHEMGSELAALPPHHKDSLQSRQVWGNVHSSIGSRLGWSGSILMEAYSPFLQTQFLQSQGPGVRGRQTAQHYSRHVWSSEVHGRDTRSFIMSDPHRLPVS